VFLICGSGDDNNVTIPSTTPDGNYVIEINDLSLEECKVIKSIDTSAVTKDVGDIEDGDSKEDIIEMKPPLIPSEIFEKYKCIQSIEANKSIKLKIANENKTEN
jgi:hypothetical protein